MAESNQGSQGSVFISYSRKDKPFVQKLNDALDNSGVQAWVDWEGIELASDWMQRITSAIQSTDAFLFIISPDSLNSKVCADELELGIKLNKKLIPILHREPEKGQTMHEKLSATNWVYMREGDNFDNTLPKLIEAIQTDLEWVSKHTQLLNQATEWEDRDRNNSFLLQGTELEDAEKWMAEASGKENRNILPLQAEFIRTSRKAAERRQRVLLAGVSLALVVSIVLSILALIARNEAKAAQQVSLTNEAIAVANERAAATARADAVTNEHKARESEQIANHNAILANASKGVAEAQILQNRSGELDTSTLVAIEAYRLQLDNNVKDTFQAENLIRINSSIMARPVAQMKQDGAIWNIAWSPDYQFFVTGNNQDPSNENAVAQACVYRAGDGQVEYCVSHESDVNDVIFTNDGKYLVTASADKTVRFWDAVKGAPLDDLTLTFEGSALDLDANDEVVAMAREDNFLTLYYLNKPDLDPVNVEQADGIASVKFSPSGELLAFGLQNGQVRFWQARSNFYYNGPRHEPSSYAVLAWSPDNQWLASGGGDSFAKLTKRDGSFKYPVTHQDWVEGVAFGPDPSWFATASDDNIIRVINTDNGTERFRMSHSHFAQRVIVSADGQWIASTGYDRVVRVWDSISGTQMLEIPLEDNGSAISFDQDASRLVVADESGHVSIWDISKLNARIAYVEFTEFVREAQYSPSGEFLIVNADDYKVWKIPADEVNKIKNGTQGQIILTADSLTYDTAISPDSQWVAVVEYDSEDAQKNRGALVSVDGKIVHPLKHGGEVSFVGFTNDSKWAATAGIDGFIKFWNVQTGEKQPLELDNEEPVFSMAISPTGPLVAAGLHDKVKIWDISTGQPVMDIPQIGDIVTASFSDDGSRLATGSREGTVIIWKVEDSNATPSGGILQMNGYARLLSFSPDNKWLAGGGSTGFAYLWDIATTQEFARISLGKNPVTSVSFSRDSSQFLTVSRKVVRIWDVSSIPLVPDDKLIDYACSHLVTNLSRDDWSIFFEGKEYNLTCPSLTEKE